MNSIQGSPCRSITGWNHTRAWKVSDLAWASMAFHRSQSTLWMYWTLLSDHVSGTSLSFQSRWYKSRGKGSHTLVKETTITLSSFPSSQPISEPFIDTWHHRRSKRFESPNFQYLLEAASIDTMQEQVHYRGYMLEPQKEMITRPWQAAHQLWKRRKLLGPEK